MAKSTSIKKILVIGSGPIIIGQGAEFDYAGTQACMTLKQEGYQVILLNSNPATIMTDKEIADKVYIEPLTVEVATRIIYQDRPDAILGTLGGQTGLNLVVELNKTGILDRQNVHVLGTKLQAIEQAEDRELFKALMNELSQPIPESSIVHTALEALDFACKLGYPLVVRPAYTLGGTGGGFANNDEQLLAIVENGLKLSPVHQCLIEKSIEGYKEIEFEVMRDAKDQAIVICTMENIDPVGIHTGDSIVVAPIQTLTDKEVQMLRDASLTIVKALQICGGCNVQLALDTDTKQYYVIEVNPRVSRSSALASKATGYPIAKIAALIAVGYTLDEILNPVTQTSYACFEPALDYVVTKLPRFAFDKFSGADRSLSTQMKATGEVMAIGTNLESSLLKAVRSLELDIDHLKLDAFSELETDVLWDIMLKKDDERIFAIMELIRRKISLESISNVTKINMFFLYKLQHITQIEFDVKQSGFDIEVLRLAKKYGFADSYLAKQWSMTPEKLYQVRKENGIVPVYKMVDTCAGEFESKTPYFYSTYLTENEAIPSTNNKVIVLGSGPIRIGQGVEFDYATVHCVQTLKELGYEAIVINNNPATVSTDFAISDRLYFEPLTIEEVMHIHDLENPMGVIVQFGGQTAVNLAQELSNRGVTILGTSLENIHRAEDRNEFEACLASLDIKQPLGKTATNVEDALVIANQIGYPVLLRPSFVLGGRAIKIVENDEHLAHYMKKALEEVSNDAPILIDKYLSGKEVEIDAICDGSSVFVPGIMEHVERAGIHSGDSISVYPVQSLSSKVQDTILEYTEKIGIAFNFIGLYNIQFIVDNDDNVFVLEVNPRSSRSMPFLSKICDVRMGHIATKAIMGISLQEQGYTSLTKEKPSQHVFVKAPVFSFAKLHHVDTTLGPEMKSTGEVLGSDTTFEKALYKALVASGIKIAMQGCVLLSVADQDKPTMLNLAKRFQSMGFRLSATKNTAAYLISEGLHVKEVAKVASGVHDVVDEIRQGGVDLVINTISQTQNAHTDGFLIRRSAAESGIACLTSLDTALAIINMIEAHTFNLLPIGAQDEN